MIHINFMGKYPVPINATQLNIVYIVHGNRQKCVDKHPQLICRVVGVNITFLPPCCGRTI